MNKEITQGIEEKFEEAIEYHKEGLIQSFNPEDGKAKTLELIERINSRANGPNKESCLTIADFNANLYYVYGDDMFLDFLEENKSKTEYSPVELIESSFKIATSLPTTDISSFYNYLRLVFDKSKRFSFKLVANDLQELLARYEFYSSISNIPQEKLKIYLSQCIFSVLAEAHDLIERGKVDKGELIKDCLVANLNRYFQMPSGEVNFADLAEKYRGDPERAVTELQENLGVLVSGDYWRQESSLKFKLTTLFPDLQLDNDTKYKLKIYKFEAVGKDDMNNTVKVLKPLFGITESNRNRHKEVIEELGGNVKDLRDATSEAMFHILRYRF